MSPMPVSVSMSYAKQPTSYLNISANLSMLVLVIFYLNDRVGVGFCEIGLIGGVQVMLPQPNRDLRGLGTH